MRIRPRFSRAQDGTVAVEFALLAPVMLLMFMGMVELTDAIAAKRRVSIAASTMTDLATNTRFDWVHEDHLDEIMKATGDVLRPYGVGNATMRLTAATWDDTDEKLLVVWSVQKTGTGPLIQSTDSGYARGDEFTVLAGKQVLEVDEEVAKSNYHVITGEITYPYEPPVYSHYGVFNLKQREVRLPRREEELHLCDDLICTDARVWNPLLERPV